MADAAVTFLLESLSYQIKEYYSLVTGAKNELDRLNYELGLLRSFLEQATKKQDKEELFRQIEKMVRDVVYDVEDVIDTCLTEAAVAKLKNPVVRLCFNLKRVSLAAKMVKSLREDKVKPLFDPGTLAFCGMKLGDGTRTAGEKSGTNEDEADLPRREHSVIGFERDQEIIISCLKEEGRTNTLDVIRITGMAGLGKTTLARKIFNDTVIRSQFDLNIWVDVSQDFNIRDVLVSICEQVTSDDFNIRDLSIMKTKNLALTVRARLQIAKFFIVLDDVWTDYVWDEIFLKILPEKNGKSKVLITSRQTSVGANAAREAHRLEGLNVDESWELLKLEVFRGLECPEDLVKIGKDIAAQCEGLPMSIVVVGGILRKKSDKKQNTTSADVRNAWNDVSKDVSIAYHQDKNISKIVALSYNILPYEMKICLLYLGMFPEDYEIPVWTLIHLWIAEGFIQCRKEQTMEEAAYEILNELIDRNLVTVAKRNSQGKIKTCRVPDVIREFCISEAEQANLLQEIKRSKEEDFYPSNIDQCRRLCIHSNLQKFLSKIMSTKVKNRRVRSFLSFSQPVHLGEEYISTIPHTFSLLRVLDSKSMVFPEFPSRISKLIHLRYITLSFNFEFKVLPEALSELWNLQTLIIDTKSRTLQIKANIWKMIQLRHLKTKAQIILVIESGKGGEGGKKLQTLSRLSPKHCKRNMFEQTSKLKKLGIRGNLADDFDDTSLVELEELEKLKLVNDLASDRPLPNLPPHNCFPKNIKKLTLSGTYLDWEDMDTLGMIKCLEELKLKDYAFKGKYWKQRIGSDFPSLQFLLVADTDLTYWDSRNGQFPGLKWLVLKICVNLMEIPSSLETSLEILDIENVGPKAVQCAEEIKSKKTELKLFVKS